MKVGSRLYSLLCLLLWISTLILPPAVGAGPLSAEHFLSALLVSIQGDAESPVDHAVLVEKQSQTLVLYAVEQGKFREIFRAPCSTGEVAGAKSLSGDKKTPEGVYFFIKEHPERDLAPIYGSRAFPIDYPNLMDRLAGRGGNAIWLHGTNKKLVPRDSNGCIVVENETIERLAGYIRLHRTPIIIVDKITPEAFDRAQAQKTVLKILDRWRNALTEGTYHDYLSVYDPAYLPDLTWWQDWRNLRSKLSRDQISFSVEITRPAIFHHRHQYTVLFDQMLRTPYEEVRIGTRKLYLARGTAGLRIVGDEDQVLPEKLKGEAQGRALVAAGRNLKKPGIEHEIAAMIDGWLKAWSSKDIDQYASYYSRDFRSQGGADRDAWIRYKNQLNQKYRFIRVSRKDKLTIKQGERQSTVSFVQNYSSNAFNTTGIKKLILKREGNQWKIVREMFNQI